MNFNILVQGPVQINNSAPRVASAAQGRESGDQPHQHPQDKQKKRETVTDGNVIHVAFDSAANTQTGGNNPLTGSQYPDGYHARSARALDIYGSDAKMAQMGDTPYTQSRII